MAGANRERFSRFNRRLAISALLLSLAVGCVSRGTYDQVAGERDRLAEIRRDLLNRVERLETTN
ncbi:MAG: hypothetical protein V3T64_04955, partial [Myxococcota bacterium]